MLHEWLKELLKAMENHFVTFTKGIEICIFEVLRLGSEILTKYELIFRLTHFWLGAFAQSIVKTTMFHTYPRAYVYCNFAKNRSWAIHILENMLIFLCLYKSRFQALEALILELVVLLEIFSPHIRSARSRFISLTWNFIFIKLLETSHTLSKIHAENSWFSLRVFVFSPHQLLFLRLVEILPHDCLKYEVDDYKCLAFFWRWTSKEFLVLKIEITIFFVFYTNFHPRIIDITRVFIFCSTLLDTNFFASPLTLLYSIFRKVN